MSELIAEEKRLSDEIEKLTRERNQARKNIAIGNCPFNIGDRVVSRRGVKAEVFLIYYKRSNTGYGMKVKKVKKSGDLYVDSSETYSMDEWKLDEPEASNG